VLTSLRHTDPTYLRTIHDELLSGAVHKDNASALPQGLVGMYEEALPPAVNVNERKKFLDFFAVWALLKKEVSAEFVAPLLEGWSKGQVIDYIAQYSRWFNSPSGGTYVLYHERLRAFVLQKIADAQFKACNEAIINQGRVALQEMAGDEWERYALEHLTTHLLIQAMESKDATALKALTYNTSHWNRQLEMSKGFEWSKRMLNEMMLWASKYDDDEVIECALNKVDLHHLEQNDAPRIVEFVAQNDMETALQRIESFGGNDQEALQRKFILYMLCLMELTLLDSKDKPFRKGEIEKLLKHLDESKYLNSICWSNYFPPNVVFELAVEWHAMGVDYIKVYSIRTQWDWEISVFQDACLSKNVHIIKKLFPLIYAGTRDNDRDWLYGCAAHLLGTDWVNNTLNKRFFNDEALIRYYLSCGKMMELENHLNEIQDNERLLSASLVTAELLVLKGESNIDNYLFEIGELIDYFLDTGDDLNSSSLNRLLFRYILLLISVRTRFSEEHAIQYLEEYLKLEESIRFINKRGELDFILSTCILMIKLSFENELIDERIKRAANYIEAYNSAITLLIFYSDWYDELKSDNRIGDEVLNKMDFNELLNLVSSVVKVQYYSDFLLAKYSCALNQDTISLDKMKKSKFDSLSYQSISGSDKYLVSSISASFYEVCREKYNSNRGAFSDELNAVLLQDAKSDLSLRANEANEILELNKIDSLSIDWEFQWNLLKSMSRSESRLAFLMRLDESCRWTDTLGYALIHMRYYKTTRGPLLRKYLYERLLEFLSRHALIDELIQDPSKFSGFLKLVAFLFQENAVMNQNSFSDYERVFSQLRDISFSIIEQNIRENQKIAGDFIELFQEVLLDIFDEGNYSRILQFMDDDLAWLYQVNKKFLSELIIRLADRFDHYESCFIKGVEVEELYRYYYAAAFIELRRGNLIEFERYLNLSYNEVDAKGRLTVNEDLARNLNSFLYSAMEDSSPQEIIKNFNFPFQNNDLRKLFKASIIKYTGFSINYDVLLDFLRWQEIAPRDLERVLLCYYASRLLNENAEEILTECGNTLNIQWAIDIKNSFSAN
jgi:hypothetical protein